MTAPVTLDGTPLSLADVERVACHGAAVEAAPAALDRLSPSRRAIVDATHDGLAHYGINTGFGSLARERIADEDLLTLQRNLIRSHASGVGDPLPDPVVRATMLLLAASLCRGRSGVRPDLIHQIVALLNAGVTPVVPSIGSVGASGDLAPLAHVALVLIGDGRALFDGGALAGAEALAAAGCEPLALQAKEGLALVNGTHLMAAEAALLCPQVDRLLAAALAACAMSIDAARATDAFLDDRVYVARNQPGPRRVAAALRALLDGSEILPSHRSTDPRVQDPYSFRCAAYVVGAAVDAVEYVRHAVEAELGAVTDNPLVLDDGSLVSAGNFHGLPVALPLDVLPIALAHVAGIAERRVFNLLSASEPAMGLVPYLSPHPGLCSGLMVTQYAAAACCNELAGLAVPASVVNLTTSAGMEDYNSFGPRSAAKARRAVSLARHVVAVELLCAAQGLEYHRPLRSGAGVEAAHDALRAHVPPLESDRSPSPDLAVIERLIEAGSIGHPWK